MESLLARPATRRQLAGLALATVGAAALGLVVSAGVLVGLMLADSGLYKSPSPAWALIAGALGGAIVAAPLASFRRSGTTLALSALVFGVLGALAVAFA